MLPPVITVKIQREEHNDPFLQQTWIVFSILMVEKHSNPSINNTQTNTIDNSPSMRAKCDWWEKEGRAKVPMNDWNIQ
jgi:hypothetical protein